MLNPLFQTPYFAVIFSSLRTEGDHGYGDMAEQMDALSRLQPGYLGIESARAEIGITISYWRDEESIRAWKANLDHWMAQQLGRSQWYRQYTVRVCRVDREYAFGAPA